MARTMKAARELRRERAGGVDDDSKDDDFEESIDLEDLALRELPSVAAAPATAAAPAAKPPWLDDLEVDSRRLRRDREDLTMQELRAAMPRQYESPTARRRRERSKWAAALAADRVADIEKQAWEAYWEATDKRDLIVASWRWTPKSEVPPSLRVEAVLLRELR